LGGLTIPTTSQGYGDPERWAQAPGPVKAFGIEGTGSYGAGLSKVPQAKGHTVIEVMRPNRQLRYLHGTSDNPDAEGAARSGLSGQATGRAKTRDWIG
ncbi:MAG: IS110 family transposase, partial [Rhodobacterales bacterium]|nr:IS110 family transposase [Rhodobacterales bacterium]